MIFVVEIEWDPKDPEWPGAFAIEQMLKQRLRLEPGFRSINVEQEHDDG